MVGSSEDTPGEEPSPESADAERMWRHPSEVGLAHRGRNDRRRSGLLVGGLLAGGIGLLLAGMLLGATDRPEPSVKATTRHRSASVGRSVATVTAVSGTERSEGLGVVVDEDGRIAVPAELVDGADEVWARCTGGSVRTSIVGIDHEAGVAVLQMAESGGRPAITGTAEPGSHVRAVSLVTDPDGDAAMTVSAATVSTVGTGHFELSGPSDSSVVTVSAPPTRTPPTTTRLVFDSAGRFIGMTVADPAGSLGGRQSEVAMTSGDLMGVVAVLLDDRDAHNDGTAPGDVAAQADVAAQGGGTTQGGVVAQAGAVDGASPARPAG